MEQNRAVIRGGLRSRVDPGRMSQVMLREYGYSVSECRYKLSSSTEIITIQLLYC